MANNGDKKISKGLEFHFNPLWIIATTESFILFSRLIRATHYMSDLLVLLNASVKKAALNSLEQFV